jgi:molybdate transport system substrate-binding protein
VTGRVIVSPIPAVCRRITLAPRRRKVIAIAAVFSFILFAGCSRSSAPQESAAPKNEILVSAAVSLKEAFAEIAIRFQSETKAKVVFNFAGSGELEKQIEFGAPVDVFASAGEREMDELASKGLIDPSSRGDFAENKLVLIVPSNAAVSETPFSDLTQAQFKRIAIGNPQTVPAGHYAQQAIENNKLWERVKDRLVLAENVRQVLEYVARGEADAGLVYSPDVKVAAGRVKVISEAPHGSYGPVRYPIAIIKGSRSPDVARQFVAFVRSSQGQEILAKHGFGPVK